jgi:uncharacterized protein (TIGR00369 family)
MSDPHAANPCFGCGESNPRGMHLRFERDEERQRIVGRFQLSAEYQGATGFVHGGIIATVLDEVMSKVSRFFDVRAVTAELTVEYLKPIRIGTDLIVEGFNARREGRQLYHEGEIRDAAGTLLARGRGRFVVVDLERFVRQAAGDAAGSAARDNAGKAVRDTAGNAAQDKESQ